MYIMQISFCIMLTSRSKLLVLSIRIIYRANLLLHYIRNSFMCSKQQLRAQSEVSSSKTLHFTNIVPARSTKYHRTWRHRAVNLIQVKVSHVNVTSRCDLYCTDIVIVWSYRHLSIHFTTQRQNQYDTKLISYFITHKSV